MGTWMLYVTFATLLAATAAQTCQRDWLNAEFVVTSVGDQDVDLLTATSLGFDPTFSYFRDVIQFTDEETVSPPSRVRKHFDLVRPFAI